jgi:hypothetical protein
MQQTQVCEQLCDLVTLQSETNGPDVNELGGSSEYKCCGCEFLGCECFGHKCLECKFFGLVDTSVSDANVSDVNVSDANGLDARNIACNWTWSDDR